MHPSKAIYPQSEECPRYSRKSLELLKLQERARFSVPRTRPVVGRKRAHTKLQVVLDVTMRLYLRNEHGNRVVKNKSFRNFT